LSEYNALRLVRFETLIRNGFTEWMTTGARVVALPPGAGPENYEAFQQHARPVEFTILSYTPNSVSYRVLAETDSRLVFNEIYFPGWYASVDGREVAVGEVGGGLRAIEVGAGDHLVETTFQPPSFYAGLAVSIISAALFAAWSLAAARRSLRRESTA
jgi:uncharacterized membrane protein YfhO